MAPPSEHGSGRAGTSPPVRRVAIASSSFAPHTGGVEELVRQLAHQQEREGRSPLVLTMRWPKSLPGSEVIEGTPVRRFLYRAPEGPARQRAVAAVSMPWTVGAVALELRRRRVQVVHVQCVSSAAWFVAKAARLVGLPLVVTMQGELTMDATQIYERSPFLRSTLRDLLTTADAVTACSSHTLAEAEAWAGIDLGTRGTVVHNGVAVADFDRAEPEARDRPYLFALGRHVREKGFDVLIDAYARAVTRPDFGWQLVIAGDGPERSALVDQVSHLGLADRVDLLGVTDRPRTAALFKGCQLFVLPSRHEPFGIVNLEAMAAGKPVVASSVGGVPEFVLEGETGLLVPPEDPDALAAAIARLHDDPALSGRLAANGRQRSRSFDWSEISSRYDAVYRDAIRRHTSRRRRSRAQVEGAGPPAGP